MNRNEFIGALRQLRRRIDKTSEEIRLLKQNYIDKVKPFPEGSVIQQGKVLFVVNRYYVSNTGLIEADARRIRPDGKEYAYDVRICRSSLEESRLVAVDYESYIKSIVDK